MRLFSVLTVLAVFALSACHINYGNVLPKGDKTYEITSVGDTKNAALSRAIAGAQQQCQEAYQTQQFVTTDKQESYIGPFANADVHMNAKFAREMVVSSNKSTGYAVKNATDDYFKNAFQAVLTFQCQ